MKKSTKITLAVATLAPFAIGMSTIGLSGCNKNKISEEHILDINDFHGAAIGYGDQTYTLDISYKNPGIIRIAKLISDFQEEHPYTTVLAAGDSNSDDSFSSATHAQTLFPLLKQMGVQYSAVGNHAWEWGREDMANGIFDSLARTDKTEGNYFLASNILNGSCHRKKPSWIWNPESSGFQDDYKIWCNERVRWADPYKIINMNGHPICLIGLTTVGAATDGNAKVVNEMSFIDYNASVNYAKYFAKQEMGDEEYNKIEAFVLLTHIESSFTSSSAVGPAADLGINITTDVDAIISAHSHQLGCAKVWNDKFQKYIWVGQAASSGRAVLDTKLVFDNSKPVGDRLTEVSMQTLIPKIDYGDYDPTDPAEEQQALGAAGAQLRDIQYKILQTEKESMIHRVYDEFLKQRQVLKDLFDVKFTNGNISHLNYKACENRSALGHLYQWPASLYSGFVDMDKWENNFVVDEMGMFINRAMAQGFPAIALENGDKLPIPSVTFTYIDSITHQLTSSSDLKIGDLYQAMTHDNSIVFGYVTLGQLCNIIDYGLAGEGTFIYGADNNRIYQYDNTDTEHKALENDPITGEKCYRGGSELKTHYLAGPIQFWGMKYEVEKTPVEKRTMKDDPSDPDEHIIRRWQLKYDTVSNGKVPRLWVFDASDATNDINDPTTWNSYDKWMQKSEKERIVPILTDNFIYGGGNGQANMFEKYFAYTGEIYEYIQLNRDCMIEYCNHIDPNFPADWANQYRIGQDAIVKEAK